MKILLLIIFGLLLTNSAIAQPKKSDVNVNDDMLIKKRIEELFKLSKKSDYKKASEYIAYKGTDTTRKLEAVINYNDTLEQRQAKEICDAIKVLLDSTKKYSFNQFFMQRQKDLQWYYWMMTFHQETMADSATVGFIKVNNKYVLGAIN